MKENTAGLNRFKTQIFLHGLIFASIIEVGSLIILGPDLGFVYGLVMGTCISIVNFSILTFAGNKVLNTGKPVIGFAGYLLRLCIYGIAFYMALNISLVSGMGAILGFMTITIAIIFLHMVKPALGGRKSGVEIIKSVGPDESGESVLSTQGVSLAVEGDKPDKPGDFSDLDQNKKKRGRFSAWFYRELLRSAFDEDDDQSE